MAFVLPAYIMEQANATPTLTEAEEIAAVERGDYDLLARAHLRMVIKVARQYSGYGLPFEDLYGAGCMGLAIACPRYKLGTGARFCSYAIWWIRAQIQEFVLAQKSLVKMGTTAAQKKLFFHRGEIYTGTAEEVAEKFDVRVEDVEMMRQRLRADVTLNAPVGVGEDGNGADAINYLPDDVPNPEEQLEAKQETERRAEQLQFALASLSERERDIVLARYGERQQRLSISNTGKDGATLEELSARHGVSRERIRQIEVRAVEKMKQALSLLPPRWRTGRLQTKKCRMCGAVKGHVQFFRHKAAKDGRQSYCKTCSAKKQRAWVDANRERTRELSTKYYRRKRKRIALANAAHGGSLPALPLEHHGLPPLPIASGVISRA